MLKNTGRDISVFGFSLGIISQLFGIAYLIVALVLGVGYALVNAIILAVSAIYFGIYVALHETRDKKLRRMKNSSKHTAAIIKLVGATLTLSVSVYGIIIAGYSVSVPTLLLAVANAAFWVLRVIVELVSYYFDTRVELFTAAISADMEFVTKPIGAAKNAVRSVLGKEVEVPEAPDRFRAKLDKQMEQIKSEKQKNRELKRENARNTAKNGGISSMIGKLHKKKKKSDPIEIEIITEKSEREEEAIK